MKKDTYIFPAVLDYAEDGISIEFPDLPGCLSCAYSDEEALYMAKDAMIPAWLNELAEKEQINFSFVLQSALKEQLLS